MAPITEQLKTAADLEAAGLSQSAARLLAEKLEETAVLARTATEDRLVALMDMRFAQMRSEMDVRFAQMRAEFAEVRTEIHQAVRSTQLFVLSVVGTATALIGGGLAPMTFILHSWK